MNHLNRAGGYKRTRSQARRRTSARDASKGGVYQAGRTSSVYGAARNLGSGGAKRRKRPGRRKKSRFPLVIALLLVIALIAGGCYLAGRGSAEKKKLRLAGIEQMEAGNYAEAIRTFDQALEQSRDASGRLELDVLKYRGEAEYRLEDYEAAVHTGDLLVQLDAGRPEYLYFRSMAYAGLNQADQALADYQEAGKSGETSYDTLRESALLALSGVLRQEKRQEEAVKLLSQALDDELNSAPVYNQLGLCQMELEAYDQALECFESGLKAVRDSESKDESLPDETAGQAGDAAGDEIARELDFNRAVAYEYLEDYGKALEAFRQYTDSYGPDQAAEHEIDFLKTR